MPDHTARITEIEKILQSGIQSATVKGETVNYDLASLRHELRQLKATDTATQAAGYRRRPRMSSFRLG